MLEKICLGLFVALESLLSYCLSSYYPLTLIPQKQLLLRAFITFCHCKQRIFLCPLSWPLLRVEGWWSLPPSWNTLFSFFTWQDTLLTLYLPLWALFSSFFSSKWHVNGYRTQTQRAWFLFLTLFSLNKWLPLPGLQCLISSSTYSSFVVQ